MKKTDQFKHKKIYVLGLGTSGISVSLRVNELGGEVTAIEGKDISGTDLEKELQAAGIQVVSGEEVNLPLDETVDYFIKSPGIPYEHPLIQKAQAIKIPIYTDIEVMSPLSECDIVAITGTNGKSTTTSLVADLLNEERATGEAYVSGNIGVPVGDTIAKATAGDDIVMELSSFQLQGTEKFRPSIAVITNISSAHLDYHHTREAYVNAKLHITKNQTPTDKLIYNDDSIELRELVQFSQAEKIPFSRQHTLTKGSYVKNDMVYYNEEPIISVKDIRIPGQHNLENALAAITAAKLKGQSTKNIQKVLKTYAGMKHRLQFVMEYKDRLFYNDSKATNKLATAHAIKSFSNPIILLAGGLDREEDLTDLGPLLKEHVKGIVAMGENSEAFLSLAKKQAIPYIKNTNDMTEAVNIAYDMSNPGDIILLSPASASWDHYRNFEERGDDFIALVQALRKNDE